MASDFDAYVVLGLEKGIESVEDDIKKAYRKRAIETHPDKNRNREDAAERFDRVKRAYELLMDKEAREAHDQLIRVKLAKKVHYESLDAKRRKMKDDLEAREREEWKKKSNEEVARERLQMELERIRRKMATKERPQDVAKSTGQWSDGRSQRQESEGSSQGNRTLKVSWDLQKGDYTATELIQVFGEYGHVEDVVVKTSKKKRGSALILMGEPSGVSAACTKPFCGRVDNPLQLAPLGTFTDNIRRQKPEGPPNEGAGTHLGTQDERFTDSFENKVLARMKEAQARIRSSKAKSESDGL